MRRIRALWLALTTGLLVVLLALAFAMLQPPGGPEPAPPDAHEPS